MRNIHINILYISQLYIVFGKWNNAMAFSDEFGYSFPDTTPKLNNR